MLKTTLGSRFASVLLVATVYVIVGVVTARLSALAPSTQSRIAWRLAAWLLSLAAFIAQIVFERVRARRSLRNTALRAAAAVAVGTFALALVGPVHSHWHSADFWRGPALSLVLWPVLAGVPAFLAALVLGAILRRLAASPRP